MGRNEGKSGEWKKMDRETARKRRERKGKMKGKDIDDASLY